MNFLPETKKNLIPKRDKAYLAYKPPISKPIPPVFENTADIEFFALTRHTFQPTSADLTAGSAKPLAGEIRITGV